MYGLTRLKMNKNKDDTIDRTNSNPHLQRKDYQTQPTATLQAGFTTFARVQPEIRWEQPLRVPTLKRVNKGDKGACEWMWSAFHEDLWQTLSDFMIVHTFITLFQKDNQSLTIMN